MKRRSTLARGFHHFVKEGGGYPLPVNSVILNTSNESAYPGAKKSIKNDWKSVTFFERKSGLNGTPIIRVQTTPRCVTGRFVKIHPFTFLIGLKQNRIAMETITIFCGLKNDL